MKSLEKIIIAAVGDLHFGQYNIPSNLFNDISKKADVLCIAGDFTESGKISEAKKFIRLIKNITIPTFIIFGNHDYDANNTSAIKNELKKLKNVTVLAGNTKTVDIKGLKLGIVGTKGHGGGFAPFRGAIKGEMSTKAYMNEEQKEVEKLRYGLKNLEKKKVDFKISILHYVPFHNALKGEPPEIFLFMGSSQLGDVIEKNKVNLTVFGHAHHGAIGIKKARAGIYACNVAFKPNQGKICLFSINPENLMIQFSRI